MVQCLRLHAPSAGGLGSITGQGTSSHIPELRPDEPNMEELYIVSKNKTGSNCGSDHELLIAKFRLKLKKLSLGKPPDHSGMT